MPSRRAPEPQMGPCPAGLAVVVQWPACESIATTTTTWRGEEKRGDTAATDSQSNNAKTRAQAIVYIDRKDLEARERHGRNYSDGQSRL